MNHSRTSFCFLALISTVFVANFALAASVSSVSREQYRQDSAEEIYWEVSVTCAGIREKRLIEQRADTNLWCAKEVQSLCDRDKMGAAKKVCSSIYKRELEAAQASQTEVAPAVAAQPEPSRAPRITITPPRNTQTNTEPASTVVTKPAAVANTTAVQPASSATQAQAAQPSEQVLDRQSLLETEIEIEEQRIKIEQEKLNLRRRELELKKRELKIIQDSAS